ncbi:MAG TPA: methyltransferase domain-containing protein [Candidatus Polarisedimenticolaceae bacterium]|nr:methyltransferase domain-containing protein [Candidatus Polarisedimenticolaceae bacterium]
MREKFLELLACPECGGDLGLGAVHERDEEAVIRGELRCAGCPRRYPIERRIPRFVAPEGDYAASFGWQWQRFDKLQRDSYNGTQIVRDTILSRSGWTPADWRGQSVLECGCGSGNDTEVLVTLAGTVVSLDLSAAVDALPPELLARDNLLVLRADLRHAPFKPQRFDVVYCHRVIQHTPDPAASFRSMARHVRPGGRFLLHSYDTDWRSLMHYRYWLRPLIRPLSHATIFRLMCAVGPVLYPLAGLLQRLPVLRRLGLLLVPFTNHNRRLRRAGATLTARERYEYSLLLTFDALTPRYDNPSSPRTVQSWFDEAGFEQVVIRRRHPIVATAVRPA